MALDSGNNCERKDHSAALAIRVALEAVGVMFEEDGVSSEAGAPAGGLVTACGRSVPTVRNIASTRINLAMQKE